MDLFLNLGPNNNIRRAASDVIKNNNKERKVDYARNEISISNSNKERDNSICVESIGQVI